MAAVGIPQKSRLMFGAHEAWLCLGAIAFYLVDSMALLHADELLLEQCGDRWLPRRGSSWLVRGRRPFLPDPFAPQRPLLQLTLQRLLGAAGAGAELRAVLVALRPLRVLALAMLALFMALPALLSLAGTGTLLLAWLGGVYAVAVAMATTLWRRRAALALSRADVARLAFECIACAPLAINIVRRVTRRLPCPPLSVMRGMLDTASSEALSATIVAMLDDRLVDVDPDGAAAGQLHRYRKRVLTGESP